MADRHAGRRPLGNCPLVAAHPLSAYVGRLLGTPGAPMVEPIDVVVPILRTIQADIAGVKRDIAEVKRDIAEVKRDVAEVKQDLAEVKRDLAEMKLGRLTH
jgi:septal ring factor EnvC (AmiA/AmiB activator)